MPQRVRLYHNTPEMLKHCPPDRTMAAENPERLVAIEALLKGHFITEVLEAFQQGDGTMPKLETMRGSLWSRCDPVLVTEPLTDAEVAAEYGQSFIRRATYSEPVKGSRWDPVNGDIYWAAGSWRAAKIAAAAAVVATDDALRTGANAFALVRPPGHHCFDDPSGFCLLNNVVLAARQALAKGKRVAIIDWDYHFGDGTAKAFLDNPEVMFVSFHAAKTHRGFPTYPANNRRDIKGDGLRKATGGRSFNVQWSVDDADDAAYAYAFQHLLLPALRRFAPDVILVSAGFDAVRGDALAGMELSASSFGSMAYALTGLGAPVVAVLEGGYDTHLLATSVAYTVCGLQGDPAFAVWPTSEPKTEHKEVVDDVLEMVGFAA